ncbi:MAG: hypothetical protein KGJ62_01330 [Armatimonadetes bacterium]|nr:hypothetical protein [Armatimonadota bacterium]MDE2205853.1 hypothetical protein [Armatimonadota bacterium]
MLRGKKRSDSATGAAVEIRLRKRQHGATSIACRRDDGSITWQRSVSYFARHDLLHVAVESVLGFRNAFFGMVAAGRDINDFGTVDAQTGRKESLPLEAYWAEHIVGILQLDDARRERMPFVECQQLVRAGLTAQDLPMPEGFTEGALFGVREQFAALDAQWCALLSGETLSVAFPVCLPQTETGPTADR